MARDYILHEEAVPVAPASDGKPIKTFVSITLLCLCGILVWLLGITPFSPFTRIDVYGYAGAGRDLIFDKAGIVPGLSYLTADTIAMEKALMDLGVFESVRVFKYFPSRLQIVLEDRRAVAQTLASIGGVTVPVLLDRQGIIFGIGDYSASLSGTLPVISGITIEEPFSGMRLPGIFLPLFTELEKIIVSAPELLGAISELRINRKLFGDFDLTLYPVNRKIKVRLSELNEDLLRYTFLMLDVLSLNEGSIDTLDFRSGIASYIPKEVPSE